MTVLDRGALFRGVVVTLSPCAASAELARVVRTRASAAFDCAAATLPSVHERFDGDALWTRTCVARVALTEHADARAASVALATALGFDSARLAFDAPRLRVVAPNAHRRPAAERAYYMHRDTWYGSLRAQINVWIPLFDVDAGDSFAIHAKAFGVAVDNDSASLDFARFASHGGFQSKAVIDAAYPRCLGKAPGAPTFVVAGANAVVAFSAAHLHGTTPNETSRTRLSVDVRFVDLDDHARGSGAPDVDNRSRGDVLAEYMRGGP